MATLAGSKRSGDIRISTNNGIIRLEETWHYLVLASYKTEPRIDVASAPGLPTVGVTTSSGGLTVCKSLSGSQRETNPLYWDFVGNFSSEVEENTQNPDQSDPTTWTPVYETRFERVQKPVMEDINGDAIANSAGKAFEEGVILSRYIPVWTLTQFEAASVDDETIIERNEKINSVEFRGRAAETLLLTVASSVLGFYYGQPRRLTTYELRYDAEKWTEKRQDVGPYYISGGNKEPYLDNSDNVIWGSLDGSGGQAASNGKPAVLEFDIYSQTDFNSFLRF